MTNDHQPDLVREENEKLWGLKKPDWGYWEEFGEVQLWQAASLACDVDPRALVLDGVPIIRFIHGFPQAVSELLGLAKANIGAGGKLKVPKSNEPLEARKVSLVNFGQWAVSVGIDLPPEFPGKPEAKTVVEETALGERERTTLLVIIAALAKELRLDISQPSKTAISIEALIGKMGASVSARAIENHLNRASMAVEKLSR